MTADSLPARRAYRRLRAPAFRLAQDRLSRAETGSVIGACETVGIGRKIARRPYRIAPPMASATIGTIRAKTRGLRLGRGSLRRVLRKIAGNDSGNLGGASAQVDPSAVAGALANRPKGW